MCGNKLVPREHRDRSEQVLLYNFFDEGIMGLCFVFVVETGERDINIDITDNHNTKTLLDLLLFLIIRISHTDTLVLIAKYKISSFPFPIIFNLRSTKSHHFFPFLLLLKVQ